MSAYMYICINFRIYAGRDITWLDWNFIREFYTREAHASRHIGALN